MCSSLSTYLQVIQVEGLLHRCQARAAEPAAPQALLNSTRWSVTTIESCEGDPHSGSGQLQPHTTHQIKQAHHATGRLCICAVVATVLLAVGMAARIVWA